MQLTVYESLIFSARLRFNKDVEVNTVYAFVQEVMELVELEPLAESLVGAPGVTGLSVEQRKRLTIAVELVANPSIVFMDEPTSGALHDSQQTGSILGSVLLCTAHVISCGHACSQVNPPLVVLTPSVRCSHFLEAVNAEAACFGLCKKITSLVSTKMQA